MKKKKLLAAIISCFVIAMLCTGCGGDDEADVPVNDVAESTEPEASTKDDDSIVETVNGCKRFKVTKDEFIARYNEVVDFLIKQENGVVDELDHFDSCSNIVNDVAGDSIYPNAYQLYTYDTTSASSTSNIVTSGVNILVDDEGYILEVNIQYMNDYISDDDMHALFNQKAPAVWAALMNKSVSSISEFGRNMKISDMAYLNNDYGYEFQNTDSVYAFVMGVNVN